MIDRVERRAYRVAGIFAALDLFVLMLLVTTDVGGRYLFNSPVPGGYELVQLAMGVLVFSALPLVCERNEHISLGFADHWFGSAANRVRLVFVHAVSAIALGFLGWRLFAHTDKLIRYGDSTAVLGLPLAPIGVFMTAMTVLSVLALAVLCWRVATGREVAGHDTAGQNTTGQATTPEGTRA